MASVQPSPITPGSTQSPNNHSFQNSTFQSHTSLNDTLHSTQSLSGRSSIMTYKNKQYPSASAALAAYISDFEEAHPLSMTYHRTVEDLLSSRSVLLRTVDRSLDTGVRDTRAEWRRYIAKKLLDESYSEMVQADTEREKAQALIESSRLLTAELSPLPGSSVITEGESEATVSTEALLQAPPYPQLKHPAPATPSHERTVPGRRHTVRREPFNENGNQKQIHQYGNSRYSEVGLGGQTRTSRDRPQGNAARRLHLAAKHKLYSPFVPRFQSNNSSVRSPASALQNDSHFRGEKTENAETFLQSDNLLSRSTPGRDDSGKRSLSSWSEGQKSSVSGGALRRTSPRVKGSSGNSNKISPPAKAPPTDGQRPPPSWIQDLDASGTSGLTSGTHRGGRPPPSWIQDLEASGLSDLDSKIQRGGRAPPSWVHDLETSQISSTVKPKIPEQVPVNGGRPPPSWIEDLNSTLASGWHSGMATSKQFENPAAHGLGQRGLTTQRMHGRPRLNSASDLLTGEIHDATRSSENGKPPGLSFRDFDNSESFLKSVDPERYRKMTTHSMRDQHPQRAVRFTEASRPKKTYSFTTDDLIMASPTGKGFRLRSNTRGQYSPPIAFSHEYPPHINSGHYGLRGTGYKDDYFASLRGGFSSAVGAGSTAGLYSSTPKRSDGFKSSHVSRSLNGYMADEGSGLRSRGGYVKNSHSAQAFEEDDRQREDALLRRAQKVLDAARASRNKPSQSPQHHLEDVVHHDGADHQDNSLLTEEILEGDRPWERRPPLPKPLKSEVEAAQDKYHRQDVVVQFLDDCLRSVSENQKLTGGSQPGPVEALKNMLFTLQGMAPTSPLPATKDAVLSSQKEEEQETVSSTGTSSSSSPGLKDGRRLKNVGRPGLDRDAASSSGSGTTFDEAPGGKSLQRAMEHLSRLKVLVNGGSHQNSEPSSTNAQVVSN